MKRIVQLQFYANAWIDCSSVIYCIGLWKAKHEPPVVSTQSDDEMSEIKQQTKSKITFSAKQNKTQWIRKIKNKRIDEKKRWFLYLACFFSTIFHKKRKTKHNWTIIILLLFITIVLAHRASVVLLLFHVFGHFLLSLLLLHLLHKSYSAKENSRKSECVREHSKKSKYRDKRSPSNAPENPMQKHNSLEIHVLNAQCIAM